MQQQGKSHGLIVREGDKRRLAGRERVLTAPQEPQVLEPPAMEELHLGQVLWALTGCMIVVMLRSWFSRDSFDSEEYYGKVLFGEMIDDEGKKRGGKNEGGDSVCESVSVIVIDLRLGRGASCHREEKVTCREGTGVSIKAGSHILSHLRWVRK